MDAGVDSASYVYVWRFQVPRRNRARFEEAYGPAGEWAMLFRGAKGYRSTRLLSDDAGTGSYLTIDEWDSREDFETFRSEQAEAFESLDLRCSTLTTEEELIGHFRCSGGPGSP